GRWLGDIWARLRKAWRRGFLAGSSRQAIDRDATAHLVPSPSVRTWSKRQGKIPRRHGSAVAETGSRRANIALPEQGVHSDTSSGNRGMTVQPANSLYAAHTRRPCRTRLAARPKAPVSRLAGC